MSEMRFDGRVAIITGAGGGLGRAHALALAARGAKVVVNDLGGGVDGGGGSSAPADAVVAEIKAAGGDAMAHGASVTDEAGVADMVEKTLARWGRVDILVNNAGILRDKSFHKMALEDFRAVMEVHLWGSVVCTRAVWEHMRERKYGRIAMTTSSSGLYGNFGQANYGAAKMAVVGLMNTLHLEGAKYDIRVNTLAPTAATRMTEGLLPAEALALMTPESIAPALVYLVSEDAPSRLVLAAGAGGFAKARITETEGVWLPEAERTPETIAARLAEITEPAGAHEYDQGAGQTLKFLSKAAEAAGVKLG